MRPIYRKESERVITEIRLHFLFGDNVSGILIHLSVIVRGSPFTIETDDMVNSVFIPVYKETPFNENS